MITLELARELKVGQELWHSTAKNADGTPLRARVNGKIVEHKSTWPGPGCIDPHFWRLPMKHGLKDTFQLGTLNRETLYGPSRWSLPERWAIERFWS